MQDIKITVELCAEDRAKIDKFTDLLEVIANQMHVILDNAFTDKEKVKAFLEKDTNPEQDPIQKELAEIVANASKTAQDAPKNSDLQTPEPSPETPAPAEEPSEAVVEEAKPSVTMEMLRNKAITLAAAGKKDKVREVVHPYAAKVTELPADKWAEVYEKLTALEG